MQKLVREYFGSLWDVGAIVLEGGFTSWEIYLNVSSGSSLVAQEPGVPALIGSLVFVFLVVYAILRRQATINRMRAARAVIELVDFDFEPKTWGEDDEENIVAFIKIRSAPNKDGDMFNANKTRAAISWRDDETGNEVEGHTGRPFITNEEQKHGADLHTLDLDANGAAKTLHFMAIEDQDQLRRAIWRPEDDKIRYAEHRFMDTNPRIVTITLRDNYNAEAQFTFRSTQYSISDWPHDVYRLEQLDAKGEVIGEHKEIERSVLKAQDVLQRVRTRNLEDLSGRSST